MSDEPEITTPAQDDTAADGIDSTPVQPAPTEPTPVEPAEDKPDDEDKPAEEEPVYEIVPPEGATVDPAKAEAFITLAKEQGVTPQATQALAEYYYAEVKAAQDAQAQQIAAWKAQSEKAFKADDLKAAADVVRRWAGDQHAELQALLDTGIGNHPALVRVFVEAARRTTPDKGATGLGPQAPPKRIYENSNMNP